MSREIKFRVIRGDKIVGYERLNKGEWEWMCPDLNPDTGERWNLGVMNLTYRSEEYKREQFVGLKDKNGMEIYEGDTVKCKDHPTGVDDAIGPVEFKHGYYNVNGFYLHDYGTAWTEVIKNQKYDPT